MAATLLFGSTLDPATSEQSWIWVALDGNRLVRIDGATGQREASFRLRRTALFAPRDAGFLAVGHGSIWLTVPKLRSRGPARAMADRSPNRNRAGQDRVQKLGFGP